MGVADWGIGHVVSGVTATGEKFAGEVFTFDEGTGLAVLRAKGDIVNTHDVRILRVEGVSDLKSTPPSDPPKMEKLPVVDEARCQKREEAAVKAATISAGVPSVRPLDRSTDPRAPRPRRPNFIRPIESEPAIHPLFPATREDPTPARPAPIHLISPPPPTPTLPPGTTARSEHRRRRHRGGAGHLRRAREDAAVPVGGAVDRRVGRGEDISAVRRVRRRRHRRPARGGEGAEGARDGEVQAREGEEVSGGRVIT